MSSGSVNPFGHAGLAAVSDTRAPEWASIFCALEQHQAKFLSLQASFRSPHYRWPSDPLHTWSRCWEYPFAWHHIDHALARLGEGATPLVADIGSGVTFFPFAISMRKAEVVCVDTDPICQEEFSKAIPLLATPLSTLSFRHATTARLPFHDGEVDIAYCISVLEHANDQGQLLSELVRILRPGGTLVLTVDIGLHNRGELTVEGLDNLRAGLWRSFSPIVPERMTHPRDLLTPRTSPYGLERESPWRRARTTAKLLLRALRDPATACWQFNNLTVAGFACQKPAG